MDYTMTTPCPQCPFRTDIRAFLTAPRVREIERSLERADFPCHKTLDYDDDMGGDAEGRTTKKTQHCAGALILLEKLEQPSQMMRICERLGLYDWRKLQMDAPVFDSFEEMADAQPQIRIKNKAVKVRKA